MTTNTLSIIFGFRNRDTLRVKRCLDSLANQTYRDFNVIFVDYGSEQYVSSSIVSLISDYDFCRYVYTDTRGQPWNRSKALNIGINQADTTYVMTSDIDMIFDEQFMERLSDKYSDDRAIYSYCYYLPKNFTDWDRLKTRVGSLEMSTKSGLGALLLLPKAAYERLGSFDEFYQFWGIEDRDFAQRLLQSGMKQDWLDPAEFFMFHQWHPVLDYHSYTLMPSEYWLDAEEYFAKNINQPIRNRFGWGAIITREQRPVLSYLDGETQPSKTLSFDRRNTVGQMILELSRTFDSLDQGDTICLQYVYQQPSDIKLKLMKSLNWFFYKLRLGIQILPVKNLAKDVFWKFYNNNKSRISDFAISTDDTRYYLMKGNQIDY